MKKSYLILVIFCFALFNLLAAPTIGGSSGLIMMPTAEALKYKEYNLGSDWLILATTTDSKVLWKYKANIGTFEGLEVGFVGQNDKEGVFINLKYYLLSDNSKYPLKFALGLDNLSSYQETRAYMVASKVFSELFAGHFGFNVNLSGEANAVLMVGTEWFINKEFVLLIDTSGEKDAFLVNAGIRYYPHPNFTLNLSALNLTNQTNSLLLDKTILSLGFAWADFL